MNLSVNGRSHEIESPPLTTLLDVLREELGYHSPKVGCEQGGCGACTVLVDGEPRRACLVPVAAVDGAEVSTVEGLGPPEDLEPLQAAFVHHYAAQCGFCTPGILVRTASLLEKKGAGLDRDTAARHLGAHLCRCTGYVKILDAVEAVARGDEFDISTTAEGQYTTMHTGGES